MEKAVLRKVKNLTNFNIKEIPRDLIDLKRMAGQCPDCRKMTDDMRICLLCERKGCLSCLNIWATHLYRCHFGTSATVALKGGHINFEANGLRIKQKRLYKNYLGNYYNPEKCKETIK